MITLYRWNRDSKERGVRSSSQMGRAMNLEVPLFHFTSSHWLYRHAIITCANMQGKPSLSENLVSFPLCRESHEESWKTAIVYTPAVSGTGKLVLNYFTASGDKCLKVNFNIILAVRQSYKVTGLQMVSASCHIPSSFILLA